MDDELDELLRALAHPTRRWIVRRCHGDWVAAGDLVSESDLAAATVSEHLKVLRKTGLVELRAEGTWRRYRTVAERLTGVVLDLDRLLPQRQRAGRSATHPRESSGSS